MGHSSDNVVCIRSAAAGANLLSQLFSFSAASCLVKRLERRNNSRAFCRNYTSFSFSGDNLLFAVSVISGGILYLCNMGMVRHMSFSSASLAVYQLIVLIPLFFFTCFIPLLLVPFVLINVLCSVFLKDNLKNIWS